MYYEVAPTKIIRSGQDTFTYSSDEPLATGTLVTISVGRQNHIGVVTSRVSRPDYPVKPITSIIDATPLPGPLLSTIKWLSVYYVTPLALVLQSALPTGLTKKRRTLSNKPSSFTRERTNILFNAEQQAALAAINEITSGSLVLQGVTGSGKTEVYKQLAQETLANGKSVIVLTPEIGLTPQLIADFSQSFDDILVTHSGMTESERHQIWLDALHSEGPRIMIGPRSALFTPLLKVGAIIIDEAHEPSYKQEQSPRYSALRMATILGQFHSAKVIFGSATPLVADRYLAEQSGKPPLFMHQRARKDVAPSDISLVDMKQRNLFKKHRFLSDALLDSIEQNSYSKNQTLVFHNRRGTAQTTLCENCGWTAECPRCFIPLTLHADKFELRCHICDYTQKVPTSCPICHHADIIHKGIGTKMIEAELHRLFPKLRIARFDSDTTKDTTIDQLYGDLYSGAIDIAIGTQVVSKGLDLPHLRTVGVIQADSGLVLPDYSADERVFQLLAQVVGRVGRNEHSTNVIIQSYQPTHPAISYGVHQDYEGFYQYELVKREKGQFPPYTYLLKLVCVYKTEAGAIKAARRLSPTLKELHLPIQILGPTPAFRERVGDSFRWQLVIKSKKRQHLVDVLSHIPKSHWQFELDPTSLL